MSERLTWKKFLQKAKEAGVQDTDAIDYMDFNGDATEDVRVYRDKGVIVVVS